MNIGGRYSKIGFSNNGLVIGTMNGLNENNLTHKDIVNIAKNFDLNTSPDVFKYHFITRESVSVFLPDYNKNIFDNIECFIEFLY